VAERTQTGNVTTSTDGRTLNRNLRARDPCAGVSVHPSLRGQRPASLKAWLSSYEFRAYKKGDGRIVLHLRTTVMIPTEASFSTEAYLQGISGLLVLPSGRSFELDDVRYSDRCAIPHDGETLPVDLWVSVLTDLTECVPCTAHLDLRLCFSFFGSPMEARAKHDVTVRRIRRRGE
jgi:hypothetical protein